MRTLKTLAVILLLALTTMPLQAQFITLARKIKQMNHDNKEIAVVNLDAGAAAVFRAAADTIASSSKLRITKQEPADKLMEFLNQGNTFTLKVDSLGQGQSQITVTVEPAGNTGQHPTDQAVKAILAVCKKVGLHCTTDPPQH